MNEKNGGIRAFSDGSLPCYFITSLNNKLPPIIYNGWRFLWCARRAHVPTGASPESAR